MDEGEEDKSPPLTDNSFWATIAHWAKILESLFYVANAASQIYDVYQRHNDKNKLIIYNSPTGIPGFDADGNKINADGTPAPSAPPNFAELNLQGNDTPIAAESDPHCVVCLENKIQTIVRNCNHAILCFQCARYYQTVPDDQRICPMCKQEMHSIEKIFFG